MQTHSDYDAEGARKLLEDRAGKMTCRGENLITAGRPGEEEIFSQQVGTVLVRRMPNDPLALRISVGEGSVENSAYCVFRGDERDCIELLERALAAMKAAF